MTRRPIGKIVCVSLTRFIFYFLLGHSHFCVRFWQIGIFICGRNIGKSRAKMLTFSTVRIISYAPLLFLFFCLVWAKRTNYCGGRKTDDNGTNLNRIESTSSLWIFATFFTEKNNESQKTWCAVNFSIRWLRENSSSKSIKRIEKKKKITKKWISCQLRVTHFMNEEKGKSFCSTQQNGVARTQFFLLIFLLELIVQRPAVAADDSLQKTRREWMTSEWPKLLSFSHTYVELFRFVVWIEKFIVSRFFKLSQKRKKKEINKKHVNKSKSCVHCLCSMTTFRSSVDFVNWASEQKKQQHEMKSIDFLSSIHFLCNSSNRFFPDFLLVAIVHSTHSKAN